jgi:DNA (cytosine-5)-methyltransferase 1
MIYGSVCSGIEAASVAWHPLGWRPAFFSEIEAFPRAVLKHHYPDVPLHGDFTTIREGQYAAIDVLVGGTPCQSFSVAGLRGGLADDRGNLALEYLRLAQRLRPEWLVWENVPGVLSSWSDDPDSPPQEDGEGYEVVKQRNDFDCFLSGLVELGYGFAYRVLDAQYVRTHGFLRAVPQRRRRVFVVGHLGDWRRAAAVLFERESLQGHPAPGRQAGQRPSPTLSARPSGGGGLGTDFDLDGGLVAKTLVSGGHSNNPLDENLVAHALRADGFDASEDGTGRGTPLVPIAFNWNAQPDQMNFSGETTPTLSCSQGAAVAMEECRPINTMVGLRHQALGEGTGLGIGDNGDPAYTLSKAHSHAVQHGWRVRRLTPTECERLQGFPDGYTAVPYRGGMAADGPRYKALGNSMACNVMRWIGRRIEAVAARSQALEAAE